MARHTHKEKKPDPETLTTLLMDYMLVTPDSPLMSVVKEIVSSYQHGFLLRVTYPTFPTFDIRPLLSALKILAPVDDLSTDEVLLPGRAERFVDLQLILPSVLEKLKREDVRFDYNKFKVEGAFFFILRDYLDCTSDTLTNIIRRQICRAIKTGDGIIRAPEMPDSELKRPESFYRLFRRLSVPAAIYLGFGPNMPAFANVETKDGLEEHWFNRHSRSVEQKVYDEVWYCLEKRTWLPPPGWQGTVPVFRLMRQVNFQAKDMGKVIRNCILFKNLSVRPGFNWNSPEDILEAFLSFGNAADSVLDPRESFRLEVKAQRYLKLDSELREIMTPSDLPDFATEPTIYFTFDFAGANLQGQSFSFNEVQRDVMRQLQEAYPNSTSFKAMREVICNALNRSENSYHSLKGMFRGKESDYTVLIIQQGKDNFRLKYRGVVQGIEN
jgi:hypothetical protein